MKPGDFIEYATRSGSRTIGEVLGIYPCGKFVAIDIHHPHSRKTWDVKLENITYFKKLARRPAK